MKASLVRAFVILNLAVIAGWAAFSAFTVGTLAWIGKNPTVFDSLSEMGIPVFPKFSSDSPLIYVLVCAVFIAAAFGAAFILRGKRSSEHDVGLKGLQP